MEKKVTLRMETEVYLVRIEVAGATGENKPGHGQALQLAALGGGKVVA